jgi:ammonia channel protein AmtB
VVAFFIVDKLVGGARVSDESETTGLDLSEHDEQAYHIL